MRLIRARNSSSSGHSTKMYEGTGSWSKFSYQRKTMESARKGIPRITTDTIRINSIPASGKSADKNSEGKWVCSEPSLHSHKLLRNPEDHLEGLLTLVPVLVIFIGHNQGKTAESGSYDANSLFFNFRRVESRWHNVPDRFCALKVGKYGFQILVLHLSKILPGHRRQQIS